MNIQIFGKSKCFDTKKAERWFKERRIKYQYIDLQKYGMSAGEFRSVKNAVGFDRLLDEKAPGAERIYTAGEKEWLAWQERKDKGVPVGEAIQKEFIGLRDKLGLDYKFPFEED